MFNSLKKKKQSIIKHKNLLSHIKIGIEILTFGDIEIEKNKFWEDIDNEKVLVSNKIYFVEKNYKYFIGYLHNDHKIKPLNIMLPKSNVYVKSYDGQPKWMCFLIEGDELLEKYNTIQDKVSADI